MLKDKTFNEYNVKNLFKFAKEIPQQNSDLFVAYFDITLLFTEKLSPDFPCNIKQI